MEPLGRLEVACIEELSSRRRFPSPHDIDTYLCKATGRERVSSQTSAAAPGCVATSCRCHPACPPHLPWRRRQRLALAIAQVSGTGIGPPHSLSSMAIGRKVVSRASICGASAAAPSSRAQVLELQVPAQ